MVLEAASKELWSYWSPKFAAIHGTDTPTPLGVTAEKLTFGTCHMGNPGLYPFGESVVDKTPLSGVPPEYM